MNFLHKKLYELEQKLGLQLLKLDKIQYEIDELLSEIDDVERAMDYIRQADGKEIQ